VPSRRTCPQCHRERWIPLATAPYCTESCQRAARRVTCCICGIQRDPTSRAVSYRSLDKKWWCADETACTERRALAEITGRGGTGAPAADIAAMYRALNQVWAGLEKNGWEL
jgi:hypothetical protein